MGTFLFPNGLLRNVQILYLSAIMASVLLVIFIVIIGSFTSTQPIQQQKLRYSVGLSEPLNSTLEWDYDENDIKSLILQWNITRLSGDGGLLAFSSYDNRTDRADVILLDGNDKIYQAFTNEKSQLMLSKNKNFEGKVLTSVSVDNGKKRRSTVQIKRRFNTCDKQNYIIDQGTVHLLTGSVIKADMNKIENEEKTVELSFQGMSLTLERAQLRKSKVQFPSVPNNAFHQDFRNKNVKIPNTDTTYWCTRFKLSDEIMNKPHHIIRFDGLVSPQSEGIVHHMELFHCGVKANVFVDDFNGPCTAEQKPMGLSECRRVLGAWALGATNFTYPELAGGMVGGPGSSPYVVLEVHFNNPYLKANIIDQSGIRLYYSATRRTFDAGIMEIGLEYNPKNSIPPDRKAFRLSGYCAADCTQVGLPPKGITVFASQLHTHLTGVQAFTRVIKPDGRIETLNIDRHYSPHFQEIRVLPKPIRIERGDAIIHTCIFNTETRANMTFGGYAITDEMCVNYIHYYPRADLELCKTSVQDDSLDQFFETMNDIDHAGTSSEKTIYENFSSIRWRPLTARILQSFYERAPIHLSCNGSDGTYLKGQNWRDDYSAEEPQQRDVPLDKDAKCN